MNYTLTISDSERQAIASAIGKLVEALTNAKPVIEQAASAPSLQSPAAAPAPPTRPAPIEQRDRWAKDRKGNELPNPAGCYPADVHLWKAEQTPKWLQVSWQASSGNGHADAKCFDKDLWPWIIQAKVVGNKVRLYVARKGNYSNIVGIRA